MKTLLRIFTIVLTPIKEFIKNECQLLKTRKDELSKINYYLAVFVIAMFCIVIFYPGFFSNDSLDQWNQAKLNEYKTWHPIIMSVIWHHISKLFGAGSFFMLNQIMYWLGIGLFIDITLGRRLRYLAIAFFPPIFMMSLNVWKDVACFTSLTLGIDFLLLWLKNHKRLSLVIAGIFFLYACLVRLNGYIPTVTIVITTVFCFWPGNIIKKISISLCFAFLLGLSVKSSNELLNLTYKPRTDHPLPTLMVWDIAGIYVNEKLNLPPPKIVHVVDEAEAQRWLNNYLPTVCSICWTSGIDCNNRSSKEDLILLQTWLKTVAEHPLSYLKHRLHLTRDLWGFRDYVYYPYHGFWQNHQTEKSLFPGPVGDALFARLDHLFHILEHTLIFQPIVWILINLFVTLAEGLKFLRHGTLHKKSKLTLAIALSGLANAVSLVFLAVAADYRYMIWTIMAGILSLTLHITKSERLIVNARENNAHENNT